MPSYANVCADGATKLDLFYFESEWQPFLCPPLLFLLIPSLTYDCLSLFELIATSCAVQRGWAEIHRRRTVCRGICTLSNWQNINGIQYITYCRLKIWLWQVWRRQVSMWLVVSTVPVSMLAISAVLCRLNHQFIFPCSHPCTKYMYMDR